MVFALAVLATCLFFALDHPGERSRPPRVLSEQTVRPSPYGGLVLRADTASARPIRTATLYPALRPMAERPPARLEAAATAPAAELVPAPSTARRFSAARTRFAVRFKEQETPYRVMAMFVMPGERVPLEAVSSRPGALYGIEAAAGTVEMVAPTAWQWTAPARSGLYPVRIYELGSGEAITLNAFVLVPFDHQRTILNGYRIGRYQAGKLRGNEAYTRPEGFVEVTTALQEAPVSPHFTLGQFLCKQASDYPKYVLLDERLLHKLEVMLEAVNRMGIEAHTLHVMSGFRTPFYNASIGNTTVYSRHLYGSAADVFVDTDDDGRMDDLNGDGQITTADAAALAAVIEARVDEDWYEPYQGGLGIYSPKPHRGPFVHVDVRGYLARW